MPISPFKHPALPVLFCLLISQTVFGKRPEPVRSGHPFAGSRIGEIVSIVVRDAQDTATLVKSGRRWITATDRYPADTALIGNALRSLVSLEDGTVQASPKDSLAFGFAPPEVKSVEWKEKTGKSHRVLLGRFIVPPEPEEDSTRRSHAHDPVPPPPAEPNRDSTYWKRPDSRRIHITPGNPGAIASDESRWKDRSIFPAFIYEDVQSITVDWQDSAGTRHHYKLERVSDTLARLAEPKAAPIPRRNAARVFVQTPQFVVDDFVAEGDPNLRKDEFEKPVIAIRIVTKGGGNMFIKAGHSVGGFQYALHPSYGIPVKIYQWRFDFFKKTVAELLDPDNLLKEPE